MFYCKSCDQIVEGAHFCPGTNGHGTRVRYSAGSSDGQADLRRRREDLLKELHKIDRKLESVPDTPGREAGSIASRWLLQRAAKPGGVVVRMANNVMAHALVDSGLATWCGRNTIVATEPGRARIGEVRHDQLS